MEDQKPLVKWSIDGHVLCVAVSHDGTLVACGSTDNAIYVWDLNTGCIVVGPIRGHTGYIWSVAFSPHDTHVVSSSDDCTMRVWELKTGEQQGYPLHRHVSSVYSLANSANGALIASGSHDCTITLWDTMTAAPTEGPIMRHNYSVYSVIFSHDGSLLASGSRDRTIRIWDTSTRTQIGNPLVGHTGSVLSVVFSPNDTRIASGSDDHTIRIWSVCTWKAIGEPLKGHTGSVYSVLFLPDGKHIVSCSDDGTIRMWNAYNGDVVGNTIMGHAGPIYSIALTLDGTHIVSGSGDQSVCVWKMPQLHQPLEMVSSKMSSQEMFSCLLAHGCTDISSEIDIDLNSSPAIDSGGFGYIWKTRMRDGRAVAIKTLRPGILKAGVDNMKRAMREIYVCSKIKHPYVQELMGVIVFQGTLGMVSPWMDHGNLQQYLENHPEVSRYPLCMQLAEGLSYLHGVNLVHGDLKASNVLVSEQGVLKINDFDHAILSDCSLDFSATSNPGGGTFRWMAPELHMSEEETEAAIPYSRSKEADVYALGMTMLEIVTGAPPYAEYRHHMGVCRAILMKKFPKRPPQLLEPNPHANPMWALLNKCWDYDPSARPDASSVLQLLREFVV